MEWRSIVTWILCRKRPLRRTMMKFALLIVSLAVFSAKAAEDYYKVKYNLNLSEAVKNDRLLTNIINCITDKGPCSAAGQELKRIVPDALENNCKRCSPPQKDDAYKAIKYLTSNKPEMWKMLEDKFDPQGKFRKSVKNDPTFVKYNIQF